MKYRAPDAVRVSNDAQMDEAEAQTRGRWLFKCLCSCDLTDVRLSVAIPTIAMLAVILRVLQHLATVA